MLLVVSHQRMCRQIDPPRRPTTAAAPAAVSAWCTSGAGAVAGPARTSRGREFRTPDGPNRDANSRGRVFRARTDRRPRGVGVGIPEQEQHVVAIARLAVAVRQRPRAHVGVQAGEVVDRRRRHACRRRRRRDAREPLELIPVAFGGRADRHASNVSLEGSRSADKRASRSNISLRSPLLRVTRSMWSSLNRPGSALSGVAARC